MAALVIDTQCKQEVLKKDGQGMYGLKFEKKVNIILLLPFIYLDKKV